MVRKKVIVKKIENPSSLQVTYCKRRDGIIKKASELAVLCDTDVGLVMFSPTGRLNSFASNGRIEDIFLRYIDRPNELRGGPIENEEAKLLGKQIVPLEPDSIEVGKEKESQSSEVPVLDIKDSNFMAEESVDSNGRRNPVMEDHHQQKTCSLGGPHLSIDYLKTQSNWNLQCGSTSQG
nr:agamous-like mads-box protein [Quercus suber]